MVDVKAKVTEVTLTLTYEEASVVRQVFNNVGGNPSGPRGIIQNINNALAKVGIDPSKYNLLDDYNNEHSFYFQ